MCKADVAETMHDIFFCYGSAANIADTVYTVVFESYITEPTL